MTTLTDDNFSLSAPTSAALGPGNARAIDCTARQAVTNIAIDRSERTSALVAQYLRTSLSDNTRRAYQSDLEHFIGWGGRIPATDLMVAAYIADHADALSVATLARRMVSISRAHQGRGLPSPSSSQLVRKTFHGIKRTIGVAQAQAKPLLKEDLFEVLAAMGDGILDIRDKALLLLGFAGGFRRSELVCLECPDIERVRQGLAVNIRRSKTDQVGTGRKIGIPLGRGRWCPVLTLETWLSAAAIASGPIFRRVDKNGRVLSQQLSGAAVSLVVKYRVAAVGLDPASYSGHSLRAGFATSAAQAGVSSWKIRQQTGHKSDAMLSRYVRDGEVFINNAAGALL